MIGSFTWLLIFILFGGGGISSIQAVERSASFHGKTQEMLQTEFSSIFSGKDEPVYSIHCRDNPEKRLLIASEISKLYGAFLTPKMHESDLCAALQERGMWIQKRCVYHPIPTPLQISSFMSALERELLRNFEDAKEGFARVHLGYDYGPTSEILELVFREVGLDANFYYLLPYKSHTHIYIKEGEITVRLNFKGPVI